MTPARRAPTRGARAFAATWWGQAWITALEDSTLDSGRLSRGRTYARKGMVGAVVVGPGQMKAPVQGSQPRPYRSSVHVPVLTDGQWGTLLDAIAARAGHVAALLDGEMPAELVEDTRAAGVPLLPRPTELDPECSCPDWGYPCKHAAALCYAIAARIDEDPFVLFALRGRDREQVFAALRERRMAERPGAEEAPAGVPAAAAYARWTEEQPALPEPRRPAAGRAAGPANSHLPVDPPAESGLSARDLERLAADTAGRARQLLAGDHTSLALAQRQDAVRLTVTQRNPEWFHALQAGTGLRPMELARLTRAWRHGGATGLAVAEETPPADPAAMSAARTALGEALAEMAPRDTPDAPLPLRAWRNRLTLGDTGLQLRLGPDGRWYPYIQENGEWWPCASADPDPVAALTAAWDR
ncbi:SWIM zinc finger family protein [Kitasatospora sp. GP82]|uniref:SWIM zinc finger family protein n=1 Tax=Kitasatospora sp. GP82 TaxID=3035089 RepID=UPI0024753EAE|nr:SWIM zinc finger family protein [Kitasatospora sp. GP82]MDH6124719.1 putative Zn finger protein [Kitasatospora sp. GP82]